MGGAGRFRDPNVRTRRRGPFRKKLTPMETRKNISPSSKSSFAGDRRRAEGKREGRHVPVSLLSDPVNSLTG